MNQNSERVNVFKIENILISVFIIAFSIYIADSRLVARDEGFYLLAAKEVMSGKLPYLDFFYPQTPLFPYIFGFCLDIMGFTWDSARLLSALISSAIGILSFTYIRRNYCLICSLAVAIIITFSGMNIAWFLTAKNYGLSALILVFLYLILKEKNLNKSNLLICGILVGLLFNIRSYLVIIGFIPTAIIFFKLKDPKKFIYLALGAIVTLIPHIFLLLADPETYSFNNIGYHLIRSNRSSEQLAQGKLKVLSYLLGFIPVVKFKGYQIAILVWSWIALLVLSLLRSSWPSLAWFFCTVLIAVSLVPSPTWLQYFSVAVPFLVICLVELSTGLSKKLAPIVLGFLAIYFVYTGLADVKNYTGTGKGVHGIYETNLEASRLENISEISNKINELSEPGELVISVWPGYLFESKAKAFPGMENQFWIRVGHKLSDEDTSKYKIMTLRALQEAVRSKKAKLIVIDLHKAGRFFPKKVLQKSGYKEVAKVHNVLFYYLRTAN